MKTFLITGVSTGFGRAFSEAAVAAGHRVVGTVRKAEQQKEFTALHPTDAKAYVFDVSAIDKAEAFVATVEKEVGAIDVLVNNAGYGHEGLLEESSLEELKYQFDVNVFGAIALMKGVLPFMRRRRSGHIINVTSMGGYITFPGISYYNGSKFALEGMSEAIAKEVKHLGIKVTALAPGGFRTDWAGRSMVRAERKIADYDLLFDPVRKARQEKHGNQVGDPKKAAKALLELVAMDDPPMHLLLGSDALSLVRAKLSELTTGIDTYETLTKSTDGPKS